MDEATARMESSSAEASQAVSVAEEARQRAHESLITKVVNDTLGTFFAQQTDKERFVSTQRIPFICNDIREMKDQMVESVKLQREFQEKLEKRLDDGYVSREAFWPVKTLVYGFVAMILTATVGAIIALVFTVK